MYRAEELEEGGGRWTGEARGSPGRGVKEAWRSWTCPPTVILLAVTPRHPAARLQSQLLSPSSRIRHREPSGFPSILRGTWEEEEGKLCGPHTCHSVLFEPESQECVEAP